MFQLAFRRCLRQDARPEPERETEEVCGCNCPVPWKAAACYLERLLEPRLLLVQQECERWSDTVQLCQWLTLSVRDYHSTPLALVALLQMPGVAKKAMKSMAQADFECITLLQMAISCVILRDFPLISFRCSRFF